MALMKVKATVERVLEKNLQDLVRGIRNNKENESKYIAECIEEIKQEMKTGNVSVKAIAVNKLTYLEMIGYDISWAAFNIIEVMSSPKFTHKRVGYLAASQSFHAGTDVLMLTTNMIRKDLCSAQLYDVGVAMSGLSCFMSPDLARDIANDVMTLMTSSKPYVRKKAILLMYKVFLCYPDALRVAFPRLKERLEDSDPGVQAAAVNVIGELARKNPRNYLSLAPVFFKLMTTSTSNWVLIKIIKLFAALTPLEPRLGKKLIEPLTNLIHSTSAMSLLYECINTVIAVLISITSSPGITETAQSSAVQLCVQKLRILIEDSDQNLKYLGLLAMARILKTHPKSVQAHKDLILGCLDDKDESIRLRALDLLYGMISKKNLMEIVKKLLVHAEKAEGTFYRDELLAKVIDICSQNNYQFVTNFEWYISVLVDLTRLESTRHGALVAAQMLDVVIRVPSVRAFAVTQMAVLVDNVQLVVGASSQAQSPGGVCEVFYAAVFLCAEFSEFLSEPSKTLAAMLRPKVSIFPGHIQSVFVHNALKLWVKLVVQAVTNNDAATFGTLTRLVRERLSQFVQNADLEVQERASVFDQLVRAVEKLSDADADVGDAPLPSKQLADELAALFAGDLNPVAPKAQKKVPVPEGLDLDSWINEPPPPPPVAKSSFESEDFKQSSPGRSKGSPSMDHSAASFGSSSAPLTGSSGSISNAKRVEPSNDDLVRMREQRLMEQHANPHYLKGKSAAKTQPTSPPAGRSEETVPESPAPTNREIIGLVSSDKFLHDQRRSAIQDSTERSDTRKASAKGKAEKGKKKRKQPEPRPRKESEDDAQPSIVVLTNFETPDSFSSEAPTASSRSTAARSSSPSLLAADDPHRALAEINLDEPLKDGEQKLPERKHRTDEQQSGAVTNANMLKSSESQRPTSKKAPAQSDKTKRSDDAESQRRKKDGAKKTTKKRAKKPVEESIISFDESEPRTNGNQASRTTPLSDDGVSNQNQLDSTSPIKSASPSPAKIPEAISTLLAETEAEQPVASPKKKTKKKTAEKNASAKVRQRSGDRDRSEYEQTFDDLLRTNEQRNPTNAVVQLLSSRPTLPASRLANFKMLAENASLKLVYQIGVQVTQPQQFTLTLGFVGKVDGSLRRFEFTVLDTMNTKLCRDSGASQYDAVPLAFQLSNAAEQQCHFAFSIESITVSQKLRGSVSYIMVPGTSPADSASEVSAAPEKLDFVLTLPCSSFLLNATQQESLDSDKFAALLSSGELSCKYATSARFSSSEVQFAAFLESLCNALHLQLVERVGDTASLHACSMQRHAICVLLKYAAASNTVSIDGKSSDSSLVSNLVDEIKSYVLSFASGVQN